MLRPISMGSVLLVGFVVTAAAAAYASTLGISGAVLGTGSRDVSGCVTSGVTVGVSNPMDVTSFAAGSGPGFNLVKFNLSGLTAGCDGKSFQAQLGAASDGNCIANGQGTLSVTSGSAPIVLNTNGCTIEMNNQFNLIIYG